MRVFHFFGKEMLFKLLDSNLSFTEYFLRTHITKYIDLTYREMQDKSIFYGESDRLNPKPNETMAMVGMLVTWEKIDGNITFSC